MADYLSLLTKAVANLPNSGPPAARQAIYDRAQKSLQRQLRSLGASLTEDDIAREATALDQAIKQLEARFVSSAARPAPHSIARPVAIAHPAPRPVISPLLDSGVGASDVSSEGPRVGPQQRSAEAKAPRSSPGPREPRERRENARLGRALHLFISYSHRDEAIKQELIKHLSPLRRLKLVADWHDRKIEPGDKWKEAISENLKGADIILMLIRIDFINSEYCYEKEMKLALKRAKEGTAVIVPIIVRNCIWKHTPIVAFQALPTDAKAIAAWDDQDDALTVVAEGVRSIAEILLNGK